MSIDPWIPAFEALQKLEYNFGGAVSTKAELADRLRDGRIKSHADLIWTSDNEHPVYHAWRDDPDTCSTEDLERDVVIRPSVWRHSDLWLADQADWRWTTGRFAITQSLKPVTRVMLVGVKFERVEVARLVQSSFRPREPKGPGGRPRKAEAWTALMHAILTLERDGRLAKSVFPTLEEFKVELLHIIKDGLSEGSVRGEISQIYNKFVRD